MRLAVAYSSKDRPELVRRTLPSLIDEADLVLWFDGSVSQEGRATFAELAHHPKIDAYPDIFGGPDHVIMTALHKLLNTCPHDLIGLLESDVLLERGWRSKLEGLFADPQVGAAGARTLTERVLAPLGDRALVHNLGAGSIVMSREAAQVVLANYRNRLVREVRHHWASVMGLVPTGWGHPQEEEIWYTVDWTFEVSLHEAGWLTMAPLPSMATTLDGIPLNYARAGTFLNADQTLVNGVERRVRKFALMNQRRGCHMAASLAHMDLWHVPSFRLPNDSFIGRWNSWHKPGRSVTVAYVAMDGSARFELPYVGTKCAVTWSGGPGRVRVDGSEWIQLERVEEAMAATLDVQYGRHLLEVEPTPGLWLHMVGFREEQSWFHDPFDGSMLRKAVDPRKEVR